MRMVALSFQDGVTEEPVAKPAHTLGWFVFLSQEGGLHNQRNTEHQSHTIFISAIALFNHMEAI